MKSKVPTETLSAVEGARLRAFVRERGEAVALQIVGLRCAETLYRAASEAPISRLTAMVLRSTLLDALIAATPKPSTMPVESAPPIERPESVTAGAYFWTVAHTKGRRTVLAEFCELADAERALAIDRRAYEIVEIATERLVKKRPSGGAQEAE